MSKPTHASVTEQPCICGYLEQEAKDPDSPIVFDARLNEYHFEYPDPCIDEDGPASKAHLIIYHCPFCGGAAPASKRGTLFAAITSAEAERLRQLFDGMRTLKEVIATLGAPDQDINPGRTIRQAEKGGQPPTVQSFRALHYTRLSKSADVMVFADPNEDEVQVVLMCKYIGSPTE